MELAWLFEDLKKVIDIFYFRDLNDYNYGREITLEEKIKEQEKYKSSSNFYQQAPFLTIAEDLLRLIKEDKVEQLIFLSAYDKRKFPNGDPRKKEIFKETFSKLDIMTLDENLTKEDIKNGKLDWKKHFKPSFCNISLELIPFESEWNPLAFNKVNETQGQTKADWIKENASDFDLVIDDNPNICKSVIENNYEKVSTSDKYPNEYFAVIAPTIQQ